jgi:DNA-binding response OmpR family regulator
VVAKSGVLEPGVELLRKPFTRQELLERVLEVLGRRRADA